MSDALTIALGKEETKLKRQQANVESIEAAIAVLGESAKELAKLERAKESIKETESNIRKLRAAIKKS